MVAVSTLHVAGPTRRPWLDAADQVCTAAFAVGSYWGLTLAHDAAQRGDAGAFLWGSAIAVCGALRWHHYSRKDLARERSIAFIEGETAQLRRENQELEHAILAGSPRGEA